MLSVFLATIGNGEVFWSLFVLVVYGCCTVHPHFLNFNCPEQHWRNFTLKSGGDQWRRQDLVSGGHDDRGAKGAE